MIDPADRLGAKNDLIDRVQRRVLERALGPVRGRRIVDFGCGTGRITSWLAARGAEAIGVDASPEMIAAATRRSTAPTFLTADDNRLPVGDGSVDAVVSVDVLQYVPHEELATVLAEWSRALRDGGIAVVVEQVSDGGLGRGAPLAVYEAAFAAAGLYVRRAVPIRLGVSSWVRLTERRPRFGRLPFAPMLVEHEARTRLPGRLLGPAYAEYAVAAVKA